MTEVNRYDRFGNLVESLDRNGNRTVSYYDLRGRVIAAVDAGGYLTESDYDSQDHVVQQRQYATALTGVTAGTQAQAPATPAAVVDRVYDVANRLVEETSAAVQLQAGTERVLHDFTYDKAGNQTSRTLAAARPMPRRSIRTTTPTGARSRPSTTAACWCCSATTRTATTRC